MKKSRFYSGLIMIVILLIGLMGVYGCSAAVSPDPVVIQPTSEIPVVQPAIETLVVQPTIVIPAIQPTTEPPVIHPTMETLAPLPTLEAQVTQPPVEMPVTQPTPTPNPVATVTITVNDSLLADIRGKAAQPAPGVFYVDAATAKKMVDSMPTVILDARYKVDWEKLHIVGSLSLPVSSVWIQFTHPEQYIDPVTVVPDKDAVIITYCAPGCPAGLELAQELAVRGYHNLFVLIEGYYYWQQAGYPMAPKG